MSEPQKTPGEDREEEQRPHIPASPAKRIIAWTAVVYMVILVLLNVYPFFHQGENLYGVFPLMVCPGAVGLFILAVYRLRQGVSAGAKAAMAVLAAACVILFVMGLSDGLPALIAGLGGGHQ